MHADEEPNTWDRTVFARLSGLIGPEKAEGIASRFADDLSLRFCDPTDTKLLEREAHITNSSAGMLGFTGLSSLSRDLETACQSDTGLVEALAAILVAKRRVIDVLKDRLGAGPSWDPVSVEGHKQVRVDQRLEVN